MDDIDLDQERRILKLEGTIAWMKWVVITGGGAIVVGAVNWIFAHL